jgi:hypothetical protein
MSKNHSIPLSARELKILTKARKNAGEYKVHRVDPNKLQMQDTYKNAGGCIEFQELEHALDDIYMSGTKSDRCKNNLIKKMYENNYLHIYQKKVEERKRLELEYKLPIIDDATMYNVAAPKLYAEYRVSTYDLVGVGFSLTPNWTYTGDIDSHINLLRTSGYIPEIPYKHKWLEGDVSAYSSVNLRFNNELEALTYVYDMMPYAMRFGKTRWLSALLALNQGGASVVGWRKELRPMKLRGSEHIDLSSRNIPFEIEGHLIITNVERLLELTNMFRSGKPEHYNYGDCDSPKKVLLMLLLTHLGISEDHSKEICTDENIVELIELIRNVKKAGAREKATAEGREDKPSEVAYYYASTSDREKMLRDELISEEMAQIMNMSAELGMRTMFYRNVLDLTEREDSSRALEIFEEREKRILDEFNIKYGYNIVNKLQEYDPFAENVNALDDDEEGGLFDMFGEEQESYDLPIDDDVGGDPIFTEEQTQWIKRSGIPEGAGIRVWDPGTEPELQDLEQSRSRSIITLL